MNNAIAFLLAGFVLALPIVLIILGISFVRRKRVWFKILGIIIFIVDAILIVEFVVGAYLISGWSWG